MGSVKQLYASFTVLCSRTKTTNNRGKSLSTRWLLVWMTMCPSTSRTPTLWSSWSKWSIPATFGIIIEPVKDADSASPEDMVDPLSLGSSLQTILPATRRDCFFCKGTTPGGESVSPRSSVFSLTPRSSQLVSPSPFPDQRAPSSSHSPKL